MRTLRSQVRWIMIAIVVLFVLSIFGMYGFNSPRGNSSGGEDYAVAEIDGKTVMRSVLEQQLRNYVERANVRDITSADIPGLYQAALENIALASRLEKEAAESGMSASDEEINAAVKEVSDQFPTKEAFMQYLDQSGIKMSDFRKNMAAQVVQMKLMEKAVGKAEVSDEEAKEFYEKMKQLFFHSPAGYTMDFIRVKSSGEAEKILAAMGEGKEFKDAVGAVVSTDIIEKTPASGPVFVPESGFRDKLASLSGLEINKPSPAIELASNDILIAVKREKVEEKTSSFDEVSGDVKAVLTEEKLREGQAEFFKGLRERTNIVILDPTLFPKPEEKKEAPVSQDVVSGDAGVPAVTDVPASPDAVPEAPGDDAVPEAAVSPDVDQGGAAVPEAPVSQDVVSGDAGVPAGTDVPASPDAVPEAPGDDAAPEAAVSPDVDQGGAAVPEVPVSQDAVPGDPGTPSGSDATVLQVPVSGDIQVPVSADAGK